VLRQNNLQCKRFEHQTKELEQKIQENKELNINLREHQEEIRQQNEELLVQTEDLFQQRKEIEKSKATLDAIFNGVSDAIFLMNDRAFVDCNLATLKLFDCKREEIIGHSPAEFSPKFQENNILSEELAGMYIERVVNGEPQSFEWIHMTKNKKEFNALVSLNKIAVNDEVLVVAVVRDITERVKSRKELEALNKKLKEQHALMQQFNEKLFAQTQEIKLKQNEAERAKAKFEAIYEAASDAIMLISNGKIVDCNDAAPELFECDKDKIIGERALRFASEKQQNGKSAEELFEEYIIEAKNGKIVRAEWVLQSFYGKSFYARISFNKTIINKKTIFVAIVSDITKEYEQREKLRSLANELQENQEELRQQNEELMLQAEKLAEQQKMIEKEREKAYQASKSKSLFLASMSHEIRTPLNGVIGMLNLLKDTKLTRQQKEFVNIIDVSSENLLNLINDILDYSKIEANQLSLEQIPINLKQTANEVVSILRFKSDEKGLALNLDFDNKLHLYYKADPIRLKQILINYCNNAIKFTEKGSVSIKIYALEENGNKVKIKFEVIDTGIGISEENQKKLLKNLLK
jgi:PAS domain S-box-containing protein